MTDTLPQGEAKTMGDVNQSSAGDLAVREPRVVDRFDDDTLRSLKDLGDIESLFAEGEIASAGDLGSGFTVLDDKRALVGKQLLFVGWQFNPGDYATEFVTVYAAELDSRGKIAGRWIINDGSTGLRKQLRTHTDKTGSYGGLYVRKGLTASDYDYVDEAGIRKPATTFYIDTTP